MNERGIPNPITQHILDDSQREIGEITRALSETPKGHPNILNLLARLGACHRDRFNISADIGDIDKAIECMTFTHTLTPDDHPGLPSLLHSLGKAHGRRFQRLSETDDCDKAIECAYRALHLTPEGHPNFPHQLEDLGGFHRERFRHLGDLVDLEKALEYATRSLAITPDEHPDLPIKLANLGVSYSDRFQRLGDLGDLDEAIEYEHRALRLTPDGQAHKSKQLFNLGTSHARRFERLGKLSDLEKAIEYGSDALELTPEGHPDLMSQLDNQGQYHNFRFQHLGELSDLEKAFEYESRALTLTPSGHPGLPNRFANLAGSHLYRFQRLGELDDLEKAIEYQSRAVGLVPEGHADLSHRLANLGTFHGHRYKHLGELDDLIKAFEYESRALELTPDGDPGLSDRLANLATSLRNVFERIGRPDFLNQSIEYESRALELTPDNHPQLRVRLANLGATHSYRFEHLGDLRDLEKGIEYESRAITLTPAGHPELPCRLANLAVTFKHRFRQMGELHDLEKAVECESHAIAMTPHEHPELPGLHFNHAISSLLYYGHTNDIMQLEKSLDCFRKASQSVTGAPRTKFKHAIRWAKDASNYNGLNPIEAYQTTIDLLPEFIWLGATTDQRYADLSRADNLATNAAYAAVLSSKYELALEWLEHARCVVWNQSLMLRSPLEQLQYSYPSLASQLKTVANKLYHASAEPRGPELTTSDSFNREQVAQQHRRLAQEYRDLLSQARRLPGFETFLRPMKAHDLVRAAKNGPIVIINCHKDRCDALLVLPTQGNIGHIPLPDFTHDKVQHARLEIEKGLWRHGFRERGVRPREERGRKDNMQHVLENLWYGIVKPVLLVLGFMNDVPTGTLPHITWCPTGALSFLPLHAAGDYTQPRSRVFDYAVSSYTPTLTALLSSAPTPSSQPPRLLAIGLESTPDHSWLPGTARELECIQNHSRDVMGYTQLLNDQATTTAVLDAMEQHEWVHLACHAHQNVQDPTKSGFFMHNGTLDLASINRRSFKNKGLAFLSACQTATGDERLPDEAIHLASSMLMAGYSSVIATMWSVADEDAPYIADKVYADLMKDGMVGSGEAGKALHKAVAALREKVGEKAFGRWVPYIHIGS